MSLLSLLLTLIVIGVLLWAITTYIPMDPGIKRLIQIVGIICAVVYILVAFGVMGHIGDVRVPQVR